MNITFTEKELSEFIDRVEAWHTERLKFAGQKLFEMKDENLFIGSLARSFNVSEKVWQIIGEFESKSPRPDWRKML